MVSDAAMKGIRYGFVGSGTPSGMFRNSLVKVSLSGTNVRDRRTTKCTTEFINKRCGQAFRNVILKPEEGVYLEWVD